jgi:hypothetical protein
VVTSKFCLYRSISGNGIGMSKEIVAHKPLMALTPGVLLNNVKVESITVDRGVLA